MADNSPLPAKLEKLVRKALIRGVPAKAVESALRQTMDDHATVIEAKRSKSRCRAGGSASKAKGRTGCQIARELILATFPVLAPDDVLVKATSMGGVDLHLSPAALALFPFGIEVKRAESLNIWGALAQAAANATRKHLPAIVFFSRSHSETYVALRAEDFLAYVTRGIAGGPEAPPQGDAQGV